MENHIFGEPVPVVHYPGSSNSNDDVVLIGDQKGDVEPSWTVDVIRKGSNVVVGTIVINNTKLPPRRNKNKKIVWKLPTANNTGTEDDIPRFGKQDYPRLWEIYKEEKKKRRKAAVNNTSSNNSIDDDSNNFMDNDGTSKNMSNGVYDDENIHVADACHNNAHSAIVYPIHEEDAIATPITSMIAPPPGFEISASTNATNIGCFGNYTLERDISKAIATSKINTSTTSIVRPPPGFS